ncbi:hypothetical protein EV1_008335 [Malus domestica]
MPRAQPNLLRVCAPCTAGGARETPTARISTSRETALVASATKRMASRAGRSSGSPRINLRCLCDIQPNPSSPLELHIRDAGRYQAYAWNARDQENARNAWS